MSSRTLERKIAHKNPRSQELKSKKTFKIRKNLKQRTQKGKTMKDRVTFNVKMERKLKIEKLAVEASQKVGRIVKWTEIMEVLMDEFAKDAQAMIIHREQEKT